MENAIPREMPRSMPYPEQEQKGPGLVRRAAGSGGRYFMAGMGAGVGIAGALGRGVVRGVAKPWTGVKKVVRIASGAKLFIAVMIAVVFHWMVLVPYQRNLGSAAVLLLVYSLLTLLLFYEGGDIVDRLTKIHVILFISGLQMTLFAVPVMFPNLLRSELYLQVITFGPLWPYYFIFGGEGKDSFFWFINKEKLRWIIVLFWLIIIFPTLLETVDSSLGLNAFSMRFSPARVFSTTITTVKTNVASGFTSMVKTVDRIFNLPWELVEPFSGRGEVEKGPERGVVFQKLATDQTLTMHPDGTMSTDYEPGDDVTVLGTFAINTNSEIRITPECYISKAGTTQKTYGTIPDDQKEVVVDFPKVESIECTFSGLEPGTRTITFAIKFNKYTTGIYNTYFMNSDWLKARTSALTGGAVASGFDATFEQARLTILSENGVTGSEKQNPVMVTPNEPAKILLGGLNLPPIGIYDGIKLYLQADIQPNWEGKIVKRTRVDLTLPEGIELKECKFPFTAGSGSGTEGSDGPITPQGYVTYSYSGDINKIPFCSLVVASADKVLESKRFNPRQIKVGYGYEFQSEKTISVTIREPLVDDTGTTGGDGTGTGNDPGVQPGDTTPTGTPLTGGPGTGSDSSSYSYVPDGDLEVDARDIMINEAQLQGVPTDYALGIMYLENNGHLSNNAVSPAGARGIMQIYSTGYCPDLDLSNLNDNIKCGVRILKSKCDENDCLSGKSWHYVCLNKDYFGWDIAARAYNGLVTDPDSCDAIGLRQEYYVELLHCFMNKLDNPSKITSCDVDWRGVIY